VNPAASERLLVGWAERDITPRLPTVLYGQFHARVATEIRDPLAATALALSEGESGDCVVLVSCDRCSIPAPVYKRCQEALRQRVPDLAPEKLVMNATHTHTSPWILDDSYPPQVEGEMTATEYADLFVERVAEAAEEAWRNRKPGSVGWGFGHAVVGHNRRVSYFRPYGDREGQKQAPARAADGVSKMYGNTNDPDFSHIEGYEDHGVDLLFTWDEAGELSGVVVNVACPSQEVESEYYVSADFWHDVRVQLRRRHGDGLRVLAQAGAAGDQSPHPLLHKAEEERMLRLRGTSRREELGRRIADAVDDVLPLAQKEPCERVVLRHAVEKVPVARWMVTDEELATAREDLARAEAEVPADARAASVRHVWINRCRRLMRRYEAQQTQPLLMEDVHAIRLGDVAFATNRFEFYLDYGLRIEARSPARQTFVVQLVAGGEYTGTYLPTARSVAGGSYGAGAYCNEVGPEGGQQLVEHTLRMLNELWPEQGEAATD